jgi:large subunit ribosomal protein L24
MPLYKRLKKATVSGLPIKKGDTVVVLTGKDAGRQGKVIESNPRRGMVVVDGLNIVTKHQKPRGQTSRIARIQSGRIQSPAAVNVSKVMLVCPNCEKPTRVAKKKAQTGKLTRACAKCGELLDVV